MGLAGSILDPEKVTMGRGGREATRLGSMDDGEDGVVVGTEEGIEAVAAGGGGDAAGVTGDSSSSCQENSVGA